MPEDNFLSEQDVRSIVALVGEAAGSTDALPVRKRKLMDGLCELIDVDAWVWVQSRIDPKTGEANAVTMMHGGLSDEEVAMVFEASYDHRDPPPENQPFMKLLTEHQHVTRRREQVVDDDTWYGCEHMKRYREPAGLDDFIYSLFKLDGGEVFSGVGLHRRQGRPPFTARETRMAHVVIAEIRWLHYAGLPEHQGKDVPKLTPRLRTVLGLLLEAKPKQTIAHLLDLSPNTVNGYMRDIYRHFKVSTHAELLRHFMAGDGGDGQ